MACEIKELEFENYGNCLSVSNGMIEAVVTIDVGPRIIYFGFIGGENVLYNDLNREYLRAEPILQEHYGENAQYFAYGGHRLWTSPERMPESYYPDNKPVIYAILPESVSFTQPPQEENGLALTMEIMMSDNAKDMMVVHSAQNLVKDSMLEGLSGCTMLRPGGTLVIPQNSTEESPYIPNRSYAFWPYTRVSDSRIDFREKYITVRQNPTFSNPFRMGTNNYSNWAAYLNQGLLFVKHYVHNKSARYPDFNSSFEVYTDDKMLEIKTLSPLYRMEPKETIRHVENWSLSKAPGAYDLSTDEGVDAMLDSL